MAVLGMTVFTVGMFSVVGALIAFGVRVSLSPETSVSSRNWVGQARVWVHRFHRTPADLASMYGIHYLRWGVAIAYLWTGVLKLLDASPAADLVVATVFWLPPKAALLFYGGWEVLIGACLLFADPLVLRATLYMLLVHLVGTFQVFVLLPYMTIQGANPLLSTLEGQYALRNAVLIIAAAAIILGTLRRQESKWKAEGRQDASSAAGSVRGETPSPFEAGGDAEEA